MTAGERDWHMHADASIHRTGYCPVFHLPGDVHPVHVLTPDQLDGIVAQAKRDAVAELLGAGVTETDFSEFFIDDDDSAALGEQP